MHIQRMKTLAKYLPQYKMSGLGALRIGKEGAKEYSILGVMADIYIRATGQGYWKPGEPFTTSDKLILVTQEGPWSIDLPLEIIQWYGLNQEKITRLWEWQARGASFSDIAKAIEKAIEKGEK